MRQRVKAPTAHRYGFWRTVAASPVMLGGLAVTVLMAGSLGPWAPAASLGWLALAGLWLTTTGERIAVRVACQYRRPSADQVAALRAAFTVAQSRTGIAADDVDLYVRSGNENINAYATGRRSIAVSGGLVAAVDCAQLTVPQAGAVLAHEIGHLRTQGTRYGLAVAWLSAPWRAVIAVLGGILRLVVGKVPTARAALVLLGPIILAVAVLQGVQQRAWAPVTAMILVGFVLVVQPLLDAALSRAGERAADGYASACGFGPELAEAVTSIERSAAAVEPGGFRSSHPSPRSRIDQLMPV